MHFLAKACKRAHWGSIKLFKPLAARFGLTPARFDLLYCASQMVDDAYQAPLSKRLGVSKTTVCKMLSAMEASGLVMRLDRNVYDRRFRRWDLTELGRRCFEGLLNAIRLGLADEAILQAFGNMFRSAAGVWKDIVQTVDVIEAAARCIDSDLPSSLEPYVREAWAARARARSG